MDKNDWQNRNRQRHREQGLCVDCNAPAIDGLSRCVKHHYQQKIDNRAYYGRVQPVKIQKIKARQRRLVEEGKCQACGQPIDDGGTVTRCYPCACFALERRIR